MDKKTLTIVGIIGAVIVILVCVVMGMELKNDRRIGDKTASGESGDFTGNLTSDEVMRINNHVYSKKEFMDYIKYTLYKNNGDTSVDEEQYAEQLENGTSKESLFVSDTLNNYYKLKVYQIYAEENNIAISGEQENNANNDYETNSAKITQYGLTKEEYIEIAKQNELMNMINSNPTQYVELPENVYTAYVSSFSGDDTNSYTYKMIQVGYSKENETESGEKISGDRPEKEEQMNGLISRIKAGEDFDKVAGSGDTRLIYVGTGIQIANTMEENSAGLLLEQKTGSKEMSDAIKKTTAGELTEVIDTDSAFLVAKVEKVEEGIVGKAKEEIEELLLSSYAEQLVYSVVKSNDVNNTVVSGIEINQ